MAVAAAAWKSSGGSASSGGWTGSQVFSKLC
jgi:hypothetical protein